MVRAPRYPKLASPPNKRMHATADTQVVKFLQRCLAARDARRYAPPFDYRRSEVE
jgi:hypothetical protein